MLTLASVVDFAALWKIALVALCGGVGVTAIFGFGVLRGESLQHARDEGATVAVVLNGLAIAACGAVCAAAIVVGVLAMAHK